MPRRTPPRSPVEPGFGNAGERVAAALQGPVRAEILDAVSNAGRPEGALARLRLAMRSHTFPTASAPLVLRGFVDSLDTRSRREGLHVLHPWDFTAQRRPDDIAPVLLADYCVRLGIPPHAERSVLSLLLDHYFLTVLSLFAVRAWDAGDPNDHLDIVTRLIGHLQGPDGSGHRFVDDAETLLLLAVSHYHPEEASYDQLLRKVRALDEAHRLRVALPCAAILGSHLRWGLRFMYRRDVARMRDDNVVDYPWLLFSLVVPMREYARMREGLRPADGQERIVAALLSGLSADPWAFGGKPPASLDRHEEEHAEFRELFDRYRTELLQEFARLRPTALAYSPLAFACNFLHNAVVATVATALDDASPRPSLNTLFTSTRAGDSHADSPERHARRLMRFASDPGRIDANGAALIVYDPYDAMHHHGMLMRACAAPGGSSPLGTFP